MSKYRNLFPNDYFEQYARICLNDTLNLNLILRKERYEEDRPDLISYDEKIGVEVTQAISPQEGSENKLFQQEYPEQNKLECMKSEAKRLNIKNKVVFFANAVLLERELDSKSIQEDIVNAITKKIQKLNENNYNRYESNRLCLFSDKYEEDIILGLQKFYNENKYKYKYLFDIVYVINNDKLIVYKDYEMIDIKSYKEEAKRLLNDKRN